MEFVKKNESSLVPQILEILKLPTTKRRGSTSAINLKSSLLDASRSSLTTLNTTTVPNELKNNACLLLNHLCNDGKYIYTVL